MMLVAWAAVVLLAALSVAAPPAPKIAVISFFSFDTDTRQVLVCTLATSTCALSPAKLPPNVAKVERVTDAMALLYDGLTVYGMTVADLQSPAGKVIVGFSAQSAVAQPWMSAVAAVVGNGEVDVASVDGSVVPVGTIGNFVHGTNDLWVLASAVYVNHTASPGLLAHFTAVNATDGIQNNVVVSYLNGKIARFFLSVASDGYLVPTSQGAFYVATTVSPQLYWLPLNWVYTPIAFVGANLPPLMFVVAASVVEGEMGAIYIVGETMSGSIALYSAPLPDLHSISAATTLKWTVLMSNIAFSSAKGQSVHSVALF
jgi:hypothetical protein